jgi:hypothetical protein
LIRIKIMINKLIFNCFFVYFGYSGETFAEVTKIFRASAESAAWEAEKELIIKSYKSGVKPTNYVKIIPLFVTVRLVLRSPVSEDGVILNETVFVYSENKAEDGIVRKQISAFLRFPYGSREWDTRVGITIVEQEESWSSVITLDEKKELLGQISSFVRKFTAPNAAGVYTISMVLFERADEEVFGKVLTDADLFKMCDHVYVDPDSIPVVPNK